jgi:hypothetical protein
MNIKKINTLVLDQGVSSTNIANTSKYFKNIKIIIIDRDPRDIYTNMVRSQGLLGADLVSNDSAEKYIKWHKGLRKMSEDNTGTNKNVLRLYFEDLVIKSDKSINKIINFLGDDSIHHKKGKSFLPSYSIKNVGIWKDYKNKSVMSKIGEELKRYCYDA